MASRLLRRFLAMDENIVPKAIRSKMQDWVFCQMCRMIMLHVYQLACGHLVCGDCKEKLDIDGLFVCQDSPTCLKSSCSPCSLIFEDRCQGRAIQNTKTDCIYADYGCTWSGSLLDYATHHQQCKSRPEIVEVNEVYFENTDLKLKGSKPQSPEDKERQLVTSGLHNEIVKCPNCQKSQRSHKELTYHIDYECQKALKKCPFIEVGCPDTQNQTRENLEDHKRIAADIHEELLLRDHVSLRSVCSDDSRILFEVKKKVAGFSGELKQLSIDVTGLSNKVEVRYFELDNRVSDIVKDIAALKLNSKKNIPQDLETRIGNLEAMLACFQEDRLTSGVPGSDLEQRLGALETLVDSFKLQESRILQLERNLSFKDSRIESLEAQLNGGEVTSYDGTLLWRITDVMKKRRDAITGKKTYLLSPPFFSGVRGYKMCVRVYPNGDGQGKGTHLSVFFTVLKGAYDALLPWPFKQVVTLSVLSQNGGKGAHGSFRPDTSSVSFQRPKKDANISSGCPLLLPLSSLENGGYVEEDCIFLQAKVEQFSL